MISVLFDHQFFSMFPYSGITRYLFELICRFVNQKDVLVSLYMGFHINDFEFASFKNKYSYFFGYKRPKIPKTGFIFNKLNDSLFPFFSFLAKPKIYHQTYYQYFLPKFNGKRVVTVHDMTYELFPEKFHPDDPAIKDKHISINNADAIISISQSTKNDLIKILSIPEDKIKVIYEANSLNYIPEKTSPIERPYILYIGQRCPHKNFSSLLDVYCNSPLINKNFDLVCFGGMPFENEEKNIISKYSLLEKVHHFTGNDQKLANFYAHARLLVYPSFYEGFGLPLLEAMHYGCPVIASNVSSLPEIGSYAGLYFDPYNKEELKLLMEKVLFDDSLRTQMIQNGYKREKEFSWDKCAYETLELYKKLV
jgi:glycosyltransferase involved in cell wall biosynthesis